MVIMNVSDTYLAVDGDKIPISGISLSLFQEEFPDAGRVRGKVMGGNLFIRVENHQVKKLLSWMTNPIKVKTGSIDFMDGQQLSGQIKFTEGSLKELDIAWSKNKTISKEITIVSKEIDIFGTPYKKTA